MRSVLCIFIECISFQAHLTLSRRYLKATGSYVANVTKFLAIDEISIAYHIEEH